MLIMSSQYGDKNGNYSPILPGSSKKAASYSYGDLFFVVLLVAFIVFMAYAMFHVPEGAKKNLWMEAEYEASVDGPKVLAELVGQVRLLRLAAEKLAGQW
jgi:hypothetical protein